MIASTNPATGGEIARYELHTPQMVDRKLDAAVAVQRQWGQVPVAERARRLLDVAQALRAGEDKYAALITAEMGKPIAEARAEIEKCAVTCDYYGKHAAAFVADEPLSSSASESLVVFDPLGVVLAIMPWNFPFWQFFRFAAPALAAGNGAILKHANNVPGCALAVERIMRDAGVPEGLFATVLIQSSEVAGLIADPRIAAVTLTGSSEVGAIVAGQAGQALKKQVLELGGSDPFIVLADADVERAAEVALKARFLNAGQSCISAKRFIVDHAVADRFADALVTGVKKLRIGDPSSMQTEIGPLAREDLREQLHRQIEESVAAGAVLRTGGQNIEGPGYYYAPTVLDHVKPEHAVFTDETFGPAAAIIRVGGTEEAIALANQTEYGLGAALWSADVASARSLARRIDAGAVFINGMVASEAALPFGGIKRSGYGRELGGYGIKEFTNIKTIWIGPRRD
jgi:succinate-semialdehyde dehydrogenase/glutarate-semialdehyde dehydrogenase